MSHEARAPHLGFPFEHPQRPISLYDYAPVYRITDRNGDWVLKRTGLAHSSGEAVAAWLRALRERGLAVVSPAARFSPNPRLADDGCE